MCRDGCWIWSICEEQLCHTSWRYVISVESMICLLLTELLQVLCCQEGLCMVRCWRCQVQFSTSVDNELATHVAYSIGELYFDYEGGGSCGKIWVWPWTTDEFFQSSCCWWNFFFRHAGLIGMMNRKFWTWNCLIFCQKHKALNYTAVNF